MGSLRHPLLLLALLAGWLALPARAAAHAGVDHHDTPGELFAVDVALSAQEGSAAASGGLPLQWCGTPRNTDDVSHAATPLGAAQFKFVYAHAADQPDRFALWADDLQLTASVIQRFLATQTGGRKAVRLDMGTDCGAQYVDLQRVTLPHPRSAYVGDFAAVDRDVAAQVWPSFGPRNVVVLADGLSAGEVYGQGQMVPGEDRPDAGNAHNRGGFSSVLWSPPGDVPQLGGWWPTGFLHEMAHNLGAVQPSSAHPTPYGHCYDGRDVMCYADGPGAPPTLEVCEYVPQALTRTFDCGGDDYFNPSPAAGSYLVDHWNVYDSAFLASCAELAGACGGGDGTPRPPVSTAAPAIAGEALPGATLSGAPGRWLNSPRFAYQWQRETGAGWADIAGAIRSAYVVGAGDDGARLRVRVSATNPDGTGVADSPPVQAGVGPGVLPPAAPVLTPSPVPAAPTSTWARSARSVLRISAGPGRGRALGAVRFAVAARRVTAAPARVALATGRYEVRACARPAKGGDEWCATRRLRVTGKGGGGKTKLPTLALALTARRPARVTFAVHALGRRFRAASAPVTLAP